MQYEESGEFQWSNYATKHHAVILLRYTQAKRLTRCSVCGKFPIVVRKSLVHEALRSVGAERLDARSLVKALALCREHASLSDDQLGNVIWRGWRTT